MACGALTARKQASGIIIPDSIKLTDDRGDVSNELFEIISMVGDLRVHGDLEFIEEKNDAARHCYELNHLMMPF